MEVAFFLTFFKNEDGHVLLQLQSLQISSSQSLDSRQLLVLCLKTKDQSCNEFLPFSWNTAGSFLMAPLEGLLDKNTVTKMTLKI